MVQLEFEICWHEILEKWSIKERAKMKCRECMHNIVCVEHLRVTNYVVNALNERYKYDSLIDTNHKL